MKPTPGELAKLWLQAPGAKASISVILVSRKNGIDHNICLASEVMVQIFLGAWLINWLGEKEFNARAMLIHDVLGEAMNIFIEEMEGG